MLVEPKTHNKGGLSNRPIMLCHLTTANFPQVLLNRNQHLETLCPVRTMQMGALADTE